VASAAMFAEWLLRRCLLPFFELGGSEFEPRLNVSYRATFSLDMYSLYNATDLACLRNRQWCLLRGDGFDLQISDGVLFVEMNEGRAIPDFYGNLAIQNFSLHRGAEPLLYAFDEAVNIE